MTIEKINKTQEWVHPDFKAFLNEFQNDRIKLGREKVQKKVAKWRLTKTIVNAIKANPLIYQKMVEVKI